VAALMAIPATVAAQTGTDDSKAVQHAADQWMAAYNAGDAAAVAKMCVRHPLRKAQTIMP
jgi:predicted component of type VI protein secretion system